MRSRVALSLLLVPFLLGEKCFEGEAPPTPEVPDAPAIGTASAGNASAEVSFTPPANSGSQPITSYTVSCSAQNSATVTASGAGSPITVSGLVNGTTYTCSVVAISEAGSSNPSATVAVTPSTVPGAPTIGTVTPANAGATVNFTAPTSNGGSAITGYTATCTPTGGAAVTGTGATSPITVNGLTNGTQYACSVIATNARGNSTASASANVTPASVPGAPTIGTVTAGNAQATIAFTPPASNGGATITTYAAVCTATSQTTAQANGSASPITVTGMTNGVQYQCDVRAANAVGAGAASDKVSVTPVGPPGAPTIGTATAGVNEASISFTAPANNGGSTVTGYTVTCTATGQAERTGTGATSPITVTALASGVQYSCTVKATNAIGTSAASGAVNVTPHTVPGAPSMGAVTVGDGSGIVAFTAPASNGGSAITGYNVTCTASGQSNKTATGATSPITVTGLVNQILWSCSVTATNAIGTGAASAVSAFTPALFCGYNHSIATTNITGNPLAIVQYTCTTAQRSIKANQLPDHTPGTFPNGGNPHAIAAQTSGQPWTTPYAHPLLPVISNANGTAVAHTLGFAVNGVRFDPATAETCPAKTYCPDQPDSTFSFNVEALGQTIFSAGVDNSNAHVQPGGVYHYHGIPTDYMSYLTNGQHTGQRMVLVGFAVDGFPIYAKWGYTDPLDMTTAIKEVASSYRTKATEVTGRVPYADVTAGTFTQDWEYVAGLGDLDQCNGRFGKTPEYPSGIYHYYITSTFPYIQRCVKGSPLSLP